MPRHALRFGVRSADGRRSGIWKVWSSHNKSDVYAACRETKGDFKISLHQHGHCHAGFTQEYEKRLREYGSWASSRHLEEWKIDRPVKQPIRVARILVPGTELRHLTDTRGKPVHWISAPPENGTASIEIVLVDARVELKGKDLPEILARWELPSGEAVWIGYYMAMTPDSINDAIAASRAEEGMKLDGRGDWDRNNPEGRLLIFGPNEGGWRSFLDAASGIL